MAWDNQRDSSPFSGLSFLWLELTYRCNLQCTHCYTESSPWSEEREPLQTTEFLRVLSEAASVGCKRVQFIGGEPSLHDGLPELIQEARKLGYSFIEVYSNLNHITPKLANAVKESGASFATSIYSDQAAIHDAITGRNGSHLATMENVARLLSNDIDVRVGFVEMHQNNGHFDKTWEFLSGLGVKNIRRDFVRPFGRAAGRLSKIDHVTERQEDGLCGNCWNGRLCVGPGGEVSACVMSKAFSLGNVKISNIKDIVISQETFETRERLYNSSPYFGRHSYTDDLLDPHTCIPAGGCDPDVTCGPDTPCAPAIGCDPTDVVQMSRRM